MADLGGLMKQSKELINSAYNKGYKQATNDMSIIELPDDTIIYKGKKYIYINHDVIKYGCGVSRALLAKIEEVENEPTGARYWITTKELREILERY